ncbi:MAG: FtsX-like permease family protein [Coriobacteriia bacterium]|nr:FtsX-like permease family protein [Coriobacteriia bacterium]
MISPRWRKVGRDLTSHKFRTMLVVLSIAVGIFAIIVVLGARGVLLREFEAVFGESRAPTATLRVSAADEQTVAAVQRHPDVAAADGRRSVLLRSSIGVQDDDVSSSGWDTLEVWSVDDFENQSIGLFTADTVTSWPPKPGEVLLERSVLNVQEYVIGDVLTVESPSGSRTTLRVAGFVHDINAYPAQFVAMATGFIVPESLAALDEPRDYNIVAVLASDPHIDRPAASRLAASVRDDVVAPRGIRVLQTRVPEPGSHFLGDIFKAVSLLLLALGFMSMLLSGFLVVTTVQALMSQQVRHVGIMKAIGGRASQVTWMYLVMVLIYGLLAIAVGLPTGMLAAGWFTDYGAGLLNFRIDSYVPPVYVSVLGALVGVAVPLLAAIVPVRLGTRMPVVRALTETGLSKTTFGNGLIDRALGLVRGLPRPVALSLRNTFLRKGRLALTLTTLVLASAVVMSVLTVRGSILLTVEEIDLWQFDAQFYLTRSEPGERVMRVAEKGRGVIAAEAMLDLPVNLKRADGTEAEGTSVIGLPPTTPFIAPQLEQGRWLEAGDTDAIVVNLDVLKEEPEFALGRTVRLDILGVERDWKVVGVVSGGLMGPVIFTSLDHLDAVIQGAGGVNRVFVRTAQRHATAQTQAARDLEKRFEDSGVPVALSQTQLEQREAVANQLGILVVFLAIMAAILALVGVIGLTGTMTINVLESTREIGVMRALGASHGAIYNIFITEGVVIAFMAWGLGTLLSWPMSVALTDMLSVAMNLPLAYEFSWSGVGIWLASVLVIAVAASLMPAYRASQVSVRDAIAYE